MEKAGPAQPSIKKFLKHPSTILNHCVNLAISGRSFKMFNDPDMQGILKSALAHTKETSTINQVLVREGVANKAAEMRKQIIDRLKGRRLSISADFGNRNGVDFLGRIFYHLS